MTEFSYKIKDPNGIHARPAGVLVKEAKKYNSEITVTNGEKKGSMKGLFSLMGLIIKCGDEIKVEISGDDEESAAEAIKSIFQSIL